MGSSRRYSVAESTEVRATRWRCRGRVARDSASRAIVLFGEASRHGQRQVTTAARRAARVRDGPSKVMPHFRIQETAPFPGPRPARYRVAGRRRVSNTGKVDFPSRTAGVEGARPLAGLDVAERRGGPDTVHGSLLRRCRRSLFTFRHRLRPSTSSAPPTTPVPGTWFPELAPRTADVPWRCRHRTPAQPAAWTRRRFFRCGDPAALERFHHYHQTPPHGYRGGRA